MNATVSSSPTGRTPATKFRSVSSIKTVSSSVGRATKIRSFVVDVVPSSAVSSSSYSFRLGAFQ